MGCSSAPLESVTAISARTGGTTPLSLPSPLPRGGARRQVRMRIGGAVPPDGPPLVSARRPRCEPYRHPGAEHGGALRRRGCSRQAPALQGILRRRRELGSRRAVPLRGRRRTRAFRRDGCDHLLYARARPHTIGSSLFGAVSQTNIFKRSLRLARYTITAPANGSSANTSCARAARECAPLRKSTGRVASNTRAPAGILIMIGRPRRAPHATPRSIGQHHPCLTRPEPPRRQA